MPTSFDSRGLVSITALGASLAFSAVAHAHFILQSPPATFQQGGLGDPQKMPPCGDDGGAVPTNMVTAAQAGGTITVTIEEAIFHPGHYRIALAVNDPSELPDEPPTEPEPGFDCGTTTIMDPPVFPVLADGVFAHTSPFTEAQSIDITLPDGISCDHCTLQIIQFMSDHDFNNPGGCFYHHCATLSIEGGAVDGSTSATSEDSGSSGAEETTSATSTEGSASNTDSSATGATTTGNTGATSIGETGTSTDTAGSDDNGDSGCSCSSSGRSDGSLAFAAIAVLALVGGRRRTRMQDAVRSTTGW